MKQANINDIISIGNALLGIVPKLAVIIGFGALVLLLIKAFKSRGSLGIMELAAIVVALSVAGRGL